MDVGSVIQTMTLVAFAGVIFWVIARRRLVRQWVIFAALGLGYGIGLIGQAVGAREPGWWIAAGVLTGAAAGAGVWLVRRARARASAGRPAAPPASSRCSP